MSACPKRASVNIARLMCWVPDANIDGAIGVDKVSWENSRRCAICWFLEIKAVWKMKHSPLKNSACWVW